MTDRLFADCCYVSEHQHAEGQPCPQKVYRGWSISWDYGYFTATSPNYDASYEGPEDGWVDNGQRVSARTIDDLHAEVDNWIAEHCDQCDGEGRVWNNADPTSGQWQPCNACLPPCRGVAA